MREFIYYSKNAVTSGNFIKDDLMKAGRMDIACQIVIMSFFVSNHMRHDVKLHLIFDGPPDAPKHLELFPGKPELGDIKDKIDISKKDVAGLIKRMLYKYKQGKKAEVFSGYWIEKKSLINLVKEMKEDGKEIYILDKKGDDIRKEEFVGDEVFILGDQEGLPKRELKQLKKLDIKKISVGNVMYFASQSLTILHNELDRQLL